MEEVGLEYNNLTIQRVNSFICSEKERRDKEERRKTGAEISASMKEDASKIKDVILENGYLITYYTCNYKDKGKIISDILKLSGLEDNRPNRKKVISKIHSMKYRTKTKEIFNQAVSKIVREGVRLDNADNKLNEQLNKQQTEEQDTISNVDKTYGIADTNETLPFFDDPFDDCENYPVL